LHAALLNLDVAGVDGRAGLVVEVELVGYCPSTRLGSARLP
jgi:hypothetical protein